ncbi:prepilin-type N-terminal cleavage/methylation domain-containing protein [bacterium]|nr:prepilin-type N-terminal cleavage/methylation domain-containing protein [bacterium]
MKTRISRKAGFTLVEIMIVVTIIGLLLVMAIPNYAKNRQIAQKNTCISNLRVIDTAKQLWGMETGKGDNDVPGLSDLVGSGLYIKVEPRCPSSGTYSFNAISEWPTCDAGGGNLHVYSGDN